MRVYIYSPSSFRCVGSALIAANTQEEAEKVAKEYFDNDYSMEFKVVLYGVKAEGKPRVLHHSCEFR